MDKKCSNSSHQENNAISFCQECKIYMCNKCEKLHSEFIENHHQFKLSKDNYMDEIFTGLCKESNHQYELKYFCKTHNILCCAECIVKIKDEIYGHHHDCDVCSIKDIMDEKRNMLKQNINLLENLYKNLLESMNEFQKIFDQINNDKEEIKLKISNMFTKVRNVLNEREDKLMVEIDKLYNDLFFKEDIIKEGEKLQNKIRESLDIGQSLNNNWDNKNVKLSIYNCLNIENNIKKINTINDNLKSSKSYNKKSL